MAVTIVLDKPRQLRYDWPAVRALAKHGVNVFQDQGSLMLDPEKFGLMLWAGLVWEDPGLEIEKVHGMIQLGRMREIDQAMGEALRIGLEGDGVDPTPAAGTPQTFTGQKPPPD